MKHPLFIVALTQLAGLVVGRFLPLPPSLTLVALALAAGCGGLMLWRFKRGQGPRPSGALLFAGLFLVGIFQQNQLERADHRAARLVDHFSQAGVLSLEGRLAADPDVREKCTLLVLKNVTVTHEGRQVAIPGRIQAVCLHFAAQELEARPPAYGDIVEVSGRLTVPPSLHNPGVFNYQAHLRARGIQGSILARTAANIEIRPPADGRNLYGSLRGALFKFRRQSEVTINQLLGERHGALLASLCFGRAHRLDDDLRRSFTQCGLMHIFAVSGLHAGMIALTLFTLARVIRLGRRGAAIVTLIGLLLYMNLVGLRPPVVRAVVMVAALFCSYFIATRIDPLSAFSLALFGNLLIAPRNLGQVGFQLSYLAVFGIIMLYPVLFAMLQLKTDHLPPARRKIYAWLNHWVISVLSVTLAANISLLPLVAHYFHRVPLIGLLSNLLVLPLAFLTIITGFLIIAASLIAPFLTPLFAAAGKLICVTLAGLIDGWAALPLASIGQPAWPWYLIAGYYAMLLVPPTLRLVKDPLAQAKRRHWLLLQVCAIAAFLVVAPLPLLAPGLLRVTFLDVGQGDCTVFEFPGGRTLVIDGGEASAGERALLPYLEARGIDRIDLALVTHDDDDHFGGLLFLAQTFAIDRLLTPADPTISQELLRLQELVEQQGGIAQTVSAPATLSGFKPARIEIVSPTQEVCDNAFVEDNDLSLVVRVQFGALRVLLTGDLTQEGERRLLDQERELRAEILKVAHHGSAASSSAAFLNAVSPLIAIISCGERNPYGHPTPAALERLDEVGARILRTDLAGAIMVETDGKRYMIRTLR